MSQVLADIALRRSASLRNALEAIDRGGVEIALFVDEDQRLLGTLTDGDVRRALLGGATLEDPAERYSNKGFTAVGEEASRAEVLDLMQATTLEQIPIVDSRGRLVGLHLLREIIGREVKPNWAVVMAGGRGERLRPLTDSIPKPMVPVAGRPILERIILHLVGQGLKTIFISVNYKAAVIEDHFGNGHAYGCRISYLKEEIPLGTGGALGLLPSVPDHPFFVLNGDLVTQFDAGQMLASHRNGGHRITVGFHEYFHDVPYGVLEFEQGRLFRFREKPRESWPVNAGIYVLDPIVLGRVPKETASCVPDLVEDCLRRGESVGTHRVAGEWIDIGSPRELSKARGKE